MYTLKGERGSQSTSEKYFASSDPHQFGFQLPEICGVIGVWGGRLEDLVVQVSGMCGVICIWHGSLGDLGLVGDLWGQLHLGQTAGRFGAPAVGDMWRHLRLGRAVGRLGVPAVGDV